MGKLVKESISFERTGNVKSSLGLGVEKYTLHVRDITMSLSVNNEPLTLEYKSTAYIQEMIDNIPDEVTIEFINPNNNQVVRTAVNLVKMFFKQYKYIEYLGHYYKLYKNES